METMGIILAAFAGGFGVGGVTVLTMYIQDMEKKK